MSARLDAGRRLTEVLRRVQTLRLEELDPAQRAAGSPHRPRRLGAERLLLGKQEASPRFRHWVHEREQVVAVRDGGNDRRLVRHDGRVAGLAGSRVPRPVEPAGRERVR